MYRRLWSIVVSEVEAEASVLELRLSTLRLLCGLERSISTPSKDQVIQQLDRVQPTTRRNIIYVPGWDSGCTSLPRSSESDLVRVNGFRVVEA